MKIELRISPVNLYLVTLSDKSFLLWKWILWCIIWFSLWKWLFIALGHVAQGARQRHFIILLGFRIDIPYKGNNPIGKTRVLTFCRESESLGSLWITRDVFIRETRLHPSQLYISISGFIILWWLVNRESDYSSHTILGQPGITALPRITAD